ncbi:MAG: hypothetical protein HC840_01080 [Leptolyngbyaceae cyanobacterium RM2_2_4]|nr:hypothetical protein [Leptolyngbyaceae cyanobacterium RM2_2_4]
MDNKAELQQRVLTEEDYVRAPNFSNSLAKFLARNSDGVENATIARLLMITEEEVETLFQEAVQMLRDEMVDED